MRINPGKKIPDENDTRNTGVGMGNVDIPEPKMVGKNRLQCPMCDAVFDSREDYVSHVMARHQTITEAPGTSSAL